MVVGIRFNRAGKVYYFAPAQFTDLKVGEYVVVETARGEEAGRIVIPPHQVSDKEIVRRLKPITRRASALDLTQMSYYQFKEQEALAEWGHLLTTRLHQGRADVQTFQEESG